jgi:DNA-binding transcriptional LysR family regulator
MATLQPRAFNSRLKVKHLDLFRNVCTHRTLRKAAEASAMTQPAATKLIQELEDMLGKPLFVRDRRGMTPTLYGQVVLHHANILMADLRNMRQELELRAQGITGLIRLGVVPSLSPQLLATVIAQTLQTSPGIRFSLREGSTSQLLRDLAANEIDLAFARLLDAEAMRNLTVLDVYAESFAVVCSPRHALVSKRRITWSDLAQAQWMMPAAGTPLRDLLDDLFRRHRVPTPAAAVEHSSFEKTQYLIAGTQLIGLLPASMAQAAQAQGLLAAIGPSLSDFGPISLVRRSTVEASPVVLQFTSVVDELKHSGRRPRAREMRRKS